MTGITHSQQDAIKYITEKFYQDENILTLLLSGSIAHGYNDERSDVDLNIIVTDVVYEQKKNVTALHFYESAEQFYYGGYFGGIGGKYISLSYLTLVAERGNEPTRFALGNAKILFDRTGEMEERLKKIGTYDNSCVEEKALRFLAQAENWKLYCDEAFQKKNPYLLNTAVMKLVLFGGRLILLENRIFFPYHKWFLRALETATKKPTGFMTLIYKLLDEKSPENVTAFYDAIKTYKDWSNGKEHNWNWGAYCVRDVETMWMRGEDNIENI